MQWEQRNIRFCAGVLVFAAVLRLWAVGALAPVGQALRSPEAASFLIYLDAVYNLSNENVVTCFVIRNEEGNVIPSLVRTRNAVWRNLWPGIGKYCYLDIPVMPTEFGKYSVEIYFDGEIVLAKNFSIISDIG